MNLSAPRAVELPRWAPGQRIGLLGGSFDPAHDGHLMISQLALSRLRLDRVWWLVTPGNPLKSQEHLPDLAARMAAAGALARDPRIAVAGFEAAIGARYTWQTVAWLTRRLPGVRFVWIMGADNMRQFHLWRRWREIAAQTPIVVVARPGSSLQGPSSPAAQALQRWRVPEYDAARLASLAPPALLFLHGPRSNLSSSLIRAQTKHAGA